MLLASQIYNMLLMCGLYIITIYRTWLMGEPLRRSAISCYTIDSELLPTDMLSVMHIMVIVIWWYVIFTPPIIIARLLMGVIRVDEKACSTIISCLLCVCACVHACMQVWVCMCVSITSQKFVCS